MKQIGHGTKMSGKFTGLSIAMQFSNAVIYFLGDHKSAKQRPKCGIELPIDESTWRAVLDIEYGPIGQSLAAYCKYFNGGQHGMGYDLDGQIDFGTGRRTLKEHECKGQSVSGTPKSAYPGSQSKLSPEQVIRIVRLRLSEIPRDGHREVASNNHRELADKLNAQWKRLESEGYFDPNDDRDSRKRILASIVQRYGSAQFRAELIDAYDGRCAVTRCNAPDALEAAHIKPYSGRNTNFITNGLLLRGDIHTLFDLNLLGIDPESLRVTLVPRLRDTTYDKYNGRVLIKPKCMSMWPNTRALQQKWDEFREMID
jgi:hypothetical protein